MVKCQTNKIEVVIFRRPIHISEIKREGAADEPDATTANSSNGSSRNYRLHQHLLAHFDKVL